MTFLYSNKTLWFFSELGYSLTIINAPSSTFYPPLEGSPLMKRGFGWRKSESDYPHFSSEYLIALLAFAVFLCPF